MLGCGVIIQALVAQGMGDAVSGINHWTVVVQFVLSPLNNWIAIYLVDRRYPPLDCSQPLFLNGRKEKASEKHKGVYRVKSLDLR